LLGGGSSRALFEYFLGYKLGLTATPKDYLKNIDTKNFDDPRELERRMLLDTYTTFGCDSGVPTFRYTLVDGAIDGILVQPTVIDARTEVTTKLLSDEGYSVMVTKLTNEGEETKEEITYTQGHFERKFFSEKTNRLFVKTLLDKGLLDPLSNEFGKTLVFAVSQKHAAKLTQLLNVYADKKWAGKYKSDFAVQVTSKISDSQQMTIDFSNDKLLGFSNYVSADEILGEYKTSRARVCVTVGMMTTGWDCPNILNLALMRPIFSPSEFIQIKGRGTRIHKFECKYKGEMGYEYLSVAKETFKLFDFFAVCEYFEEKYKYDQVLHLPKINDTGGGDDELPKKTQQNEFDYQNSDAISIISEKKVGLDGMKVDRMTFQQFNEAVKQDAEISELIEIGNIDSAEALVREKYENKPNEYYTLEKLRKALQIDRKISWRELLELMFFGIKIKDKQELMEEEFSNFLSTVDVNEITDVNALRYYFLAYISDPNLRKIIDTQDYTELNYNPTFGVDEFTRVDEKMREKIPYYIKSYIPLDKFITA
jgi:type I restriction enzyme R subunit